MASKTFTITLVDDDQHILQSLSLFLKQHGFLVSCFSDAHQALKNLIDEPSDLAILDIKMPAMSGFQLLQQLRQKTAVPVIFLTSKDEEADELNGLQSGADDYIRKPFSQRLLLERIKAVLRRHQPGSFANPSKTAENNLERPMVKGSLHLDPNRHECSWKGKLVPLTVSEFLLLKMLATHPGHAKSRDQLIEIAYGFDYSADDRTIDSHIKRIRRKFKSIDQSFDQIETLYGLGYRYKID